MHICTYVWKHRQTDRQTDRHESSNIDQDKGLHVQQTPKPWAQLPALVPPFVEHSSLQRKKYFFKE